MMNQIIVFKWPTDQDQPNYNYLCLYHPDSNAFIGKIFEFDKDRANFLNIRDKIYQNSIEYVCMYHLNLNFHNIRTNLNCRIAVSFAYQSNHNIIGKTNETFTNIIYYKLNDNGDSFWIECYDNDNRKIPINFNDDAVITVEIVFLQDRKLL